LVTARALALKDWQSILIRADEVIRGERFRIVDFGLRIGRTAIFIIALALSVVGAPLGAEAQQAEKVRWIEVRWCY
jgi:hypothetical protein